MRYNLIDKYNTKISTPKRIVWLILGSGLLIVDALLIYILYATAAWITALITAPGVVTILLTLIGIVVFGSIIMILLIFGLVSFYMGVVG